MQKCLYKGLFPKLSINIVFMEEKNNSCPESKNKRIAKNTMYLYIRMLFAVCINLYTSRLVLQYLGVEDFGVYNIIGGIVALMMFVNSSMRGATSRFITFSLGKVNTDLIRKTISSSVQIHTAIAIVILIIGETFGLWFINNELNIPESTLNAANWVYQFSLFTSVITILQVPYNACVISYERMDVFAIIEIINVLMKCVIVFLLVLFPNRLIAYGGLLFVVSIIIFMMYIIYCRKRIVDFYVTCHFHKDIIRPMLSFAVCDLFGSGTFAIKQQGINVLINRFFGVTLNAASGVATQASGIISTFMVNVLQAFKPQIIKGYSVGMGKLMCTECDILFYLLSLVFIPLYINLEYVMHLWLNNVPAYAVDFCKLLLIYNVFSIATQILQDGIHATGNIRKMSFFIGGLNLFCLLLTYAFFILNFDAQYAYIAMIICLFIQTIVNLIIQKSLVEKFPMHKYLFCIVKGCAILMLVLFLIDYLSNFISNPLTKLFTTIVLNAIFLSIIDCIIFPVYRNKIWSTIKRKVNE